MAVKNQQNLEHDLKKPLIEDAIFERPAPVESKEALPEKERPDSAKEVLAKEAEKSPIQKNRPAFSQKSPGSVIGQKSQNLIEIEGILEQDLQDVYFKMEPQLQEKFKLKGEQTAIKIEKILAGTKVKTKNILQLIIDWLKMIPGVNKFFLKQEAKIKTDEIIKLKGEGR